MIATLTGPIMQRPSSVSAIKVEGRRSHDRVRAGEDVELAERPVVVGAFDVLDVRPEPTLGALDLDVVVTCSSGTYIRALARDLGAALGVGGPPDGPATHPGRVLRARRARTLEQLAEGLEVPDMATVARAAFPSVTLTAADANAVRYGRTIELGMAWARATRPECLAASVVDPHRAALEAAHPNTPDWSDAHARRRTPCSPPDGEFLALARPRPDDTAEYLAVFSQP